MRKAIVSAIVGVLLLLGFVATALPGSGGGVTPDDVFDDQANEESKEEVLAEDDLLVRLGEENPAPVPEDPENAGPEPDPDDFVWEEGIFGDAEFPAGLELTFLNRWQGRLDGWNVIVYAGSRSSTPTEGVVLVQLKNPETWGNKFVGPFETEIAGPVSISDFEGAVLVLTNDSGDETTFDVDAVVSEQVAN